ncbi:MAG: sulfite exporter TauE/SafE family protein [Candidatus Woesearchaeota archaeon]
MAKPVTLKINGMTCASCEVLIERKFRKVRGVQRVKVDHSRGTAELRCNRAITTTELQNALGEGKYTIQIGDAKRKRSREIAEFGGIIIVLLGAYLLLKQFDILPNIGITENVSFGLALGLGVVAAFSTCMAVTGGLLLAIANRWRTKFPNATGMQRFKPNLAFNAGRIVSYTVLGGLLALLGGVISISMGVTGIITIVVSAAMVILGLQLLGIRVLSRFSFKMPKIFAHKAYESSQKPSTIGAAGLGATSFFFPCGFTQALQLYVLTLGNPIQGALVMLAFSIGTLPGLLGIGALTSFTKGNVYKYVAKASAVLVITLGIFSLNNGITLATAPINVIGTSTAPQAVVTQGLQTIKMKINGLEYEPAQFTVKQGVPVRWEIDGNTASGCAQVVVVPGLDITAYATRGPVKVIEFTPTKAGTFRFSCPMAMTTLGASITVLPNDAPVQQKAEVIAPVVTGCDPQFAECSVQKLDMTINQQGWNPRTFDVTTGVPVELNINAEVVPRGCSSTILVPKYGVAHRITQGNSVLKFTPTEPGTVAFTCSMGSKIGEFKVSQ